MKVFLGELAADSGLGDPISANAYLGAWGIVECLAAGADIVVTGRVTDASVIVAPAAFHFGWSRTDYNALAGAMAAGHVIECGAQATGGNYSSFTELNWDAPSPLPAFPIAEIHADGTSVITTNHSASTSTAAGGVTTGTVTAQLLYEVTGARYAGPDATLRLDHVRLSQVAPGRVRLTGAIGEPPPPDLKVSVTSIGGYRVEFHTYLTGLNVEAKATLFEQQLHAAASRAGCQPERTEFRLERTDHPDANTQAAATARLVCVAWDKDKKIPTAWARAAIGIGLSTFPGAFFGGPPPAASAFGVFTPAVIPATAVHSVAHVPGHDPIVVGDAPASRPLGTQATELEVPSWPGGEETTRAPLGTVVDARSGDKGGSANIGVWARNPEVFRWLAGALTPGAVAQLLPETANLPITIYPFPHLGAINIVIEGLLGRGVAEGARFDPQAKGLAEWLRSRVVDIPTRFLEGKHS